MIRYGTFLTSIIVLACGSVALPAAAIDQGNNPAISTDESALAQFQSELHSLTANVNALESRLASIEDQRKQATDTATMGSASTSAQLERAIQDLLKEVTEQ